MKEESMEIKRVEREREKPRKTKQNSNWPKTARNQGLKDWKMEPMDEIKTAGNILYVLNPLGRMKNRSGGS